MRTEKSTIRLKSFRHPKNLPAFPSLSSSPLSLPPSLPVYLLALLGAEDGLVALTVVDQDEVIPDAVVLGERDLGHVHPWGEWDQRRREEGGE